MSQLVAMFCDIDDFCKVFEPIYTQRLLQSGQRHRVRPGQLSLSEIMTIIVYFHASHYRDFKHYYTEVPDHRVPPYAVLHLPAVCIVSIPEHFLAGQSQPVSAIKRVRLST